MPKTEALIPLLEVGVTILDVRWGRAVPEVAAVIRRAALSALRVGASPPRAGELSLALVNDAEIRRLNRDYRQQDRPTNVLSFPGETTTMDGSASPVMLGDVIVAFETARAEAGAQAKPLADHLCHLVVHGVLHLLGYDHTEASTADEMEGLERDVLGRLGIPDPYVTKAGPLQTEGVR